MNQPYIPEGLPPEHIWLIADSLTDALEGLRQLYMALSDSYDAIKNDEWDEI